MLHERKGDGEEGKKECVSVLGPKVQGAFLQFLFCHGELNEVGGLEAEERAAWWRDSSSSSLALKPNQTLFVPLGQRYRYTEN